MSKKRLTISVVLIVKDEQDVLVDCLDSVRWADEIVVYDTGSTDDTVTIARRFTDKVVEGYWDDDFAAARNRATDHATGDWVLSLDADEVFDSQGSTLRKRLAEGDRRQYGVRIVNLGKSSVDPTAEFTAPRVFARTEYRWKGRLHEQPVRIDGKPIPSGILGGIRLRHVGYADRERLSNEKAERNVALARDQLAAAQAADDAGGAAVALVHLARSLTMSPVLVSGAPDVAEQAWESVDLLSESSVRGLAQAMISANLGSGDMQTATMWLERWRSRQPDNPEVHLLAAEMAARRDDPEAALAELEQVPSISADVLGGQVRRDQAIDLEVRMLARTGRADEALAALRQALRTGVADPVPMVSVAVLGEDALRSVLDELNERQWRRWTLLAVKHADTVAMRVLEMMDEYRPGDVSVLVSGARVAPLHGLRQAADWDVKLHQHGLGHLSTLITYAADERAVPDDRAVAAALAFSAYSDERALPHLQDALDHVPQQREKAVAEAIEIVAPGLVSLD